LVQVQHEMQMESLGQLAPNLTVAVAAVEDGTFAPANRLLLEPTPDPNELVQQPESGPCGFEYSRSSPAQCIGESPGDSEPTGGSEVTTRELEVLASLAKVLQVQHEMQNLEGLGQLALNLTVAAAAIEDGSFAPANRLLLEPTPDPNELVQQPESGPCGFEHSRPSPEQCIGESPGDSEPTGGSEVTTRELEVLASLVKGKSNKMIGRELNMREGTVKVHVRSLLKKLNARNRTQLALRAYRAFDTAQAVSGSGLTVPVGRAADQGST
jgi:DNA-binding CsgD family transcriptional regulator